MLRNYVRYFFRNLTKNRSFFLINITGLTIGFFACILMLLYVKDELSHDKFHKNGENIYRLLRDLHYSENVGVYATSAGPFAPALLNDYPDLIKNAVRLFRKPVSVGVEKDNNLSENRFYFADKTVFNVFSYFLSAGNPSSALAEPFTIVLTKESAAKYFRNKNPLGKTLLVENKYIFKVTGVLKKIPVNSHMKFDFLASFSSLKTILGQDINMKNHSNVWEPLMYTYLLIPEKENVEELKKKFPGFIVKIYGKWAKEDISFNLQQMYDIHLRSKLEDEAEANSDMVYVYIISITAFLVLLTACINYMNLSTSQSVSRAKEVGVRKVLGAHKVQLIRQFLSESIIYSVLSLFFAVILVVLFLPVFNSFAGKEISISFAGHFYFLFYLTGLAVIVGLLSGSYFAFFLSSYNPVKVFKGVTSLKSGNSLLRKSLIIFQFAVTIMLIIGTMVIKDQLAYIRKKDLGLNKDQVIAVPVRDISSNGKYESVKLVFLSNPDIINVSQTSHIPFNGKTDEYVYSLRSTKEKEYPTLYMISVDYDFLKTMKLEILKGRDFKKDISTDYMYGYILNESAVKKLGLENPVGTEFGRAPKVHGYTGINRLGKVIGVVKDFHFNSLHNKIEPMAIFIHPQKIYPYKYFLIKITPGNISSTINELKNTWIKHFPDRPFEFTFIDDYFRSQYAFDRKLEETFRYFAFLAVVIACLGLFGMVSFMTEQKVKEIGIRKSLGAGIPDVIILFLKDIIKLIAFSNIIAWPVAYILLSNWLNQFIYRINISISIFFLSAVLTIALAVFTSGYKTAKAACANPVNSLRYE